MIQTQEINIDEVIKDINRQMCEFERKHHYKPRFLKIGTYMFTIIKHYLSDWYVIVNDEPFLMFMGLLVCDTPNIIDSTIEVF